MSRGVGEASAKQARLDTLIDRHDSALAGIENAALGRIHGALNTTYKQLEKKLLSAYSQQQSNLSLLPKQRSLLILDEVKGYLGLMNPGTSEAMQAEFEKLLQLSGEYGNTLADELSTAIANEKLKSFSNVPIAAVRFAAENAVKRLEKHGQEFADKASAIVLQGLVQGWGNQRVAGLLRQQLGVTKGRAETIARTETLSAHNDAAAATFKKNGIELGQFWATTDDRTCPICSARNQQIYRLGESQPPIHPRCRCTIVPIRQEWIDSGLIDLAWSKKFKEDAIAQMTEATGKEPNSGLSPFEKAAGLSKPPKPLSLLNEAKQSAAPRSRQRQFMQGVPTRLNQIRRESITKLLANDSSNLILGDRTYQEVAEQDGQPAADAALLEKFRGIATRQAVKRYEAEIEPLKYQNPPLYRALSAIAKSQKLFIDLGFQDALDDIESKYKSATPAEKGRLTRQSKELMDAFLKVLLKASSVGESEARSLADAVTIDKKALNLQSESAYRNQLTEFFRLTQGGGAKSLEQLTYTEPRAYASSSDKLINVGRSGSPADLYHELGHHVEFENSEIAKAAQAWVRHRATGKLARLSALTKNSGYEDLETAHPDKFIHPYVGKFYFGASTEVISMGLEHFYSSDSMFQLYTGDPEHFFLTLGVIR